MLIYTGANTLFNHEYKKELHNLLSKDDDINKNPKEQNLDKKINSSGIGNILEIINFCLTFILVVFYVLSTYTYPENSDVKKKINSTTDQIELYIVIYLSLHFLLKVYITKQKILFLLEFANLIDIASIVMIILSKTKHISYSLKFFFRIFRMIRILYLSKMDNLLQNNSSETVLIGSKLIIAFLSLVFISFSLILEIENYYFRSMYGDDATASTFIAYNGKGFETLMSFHDAIYFGLVTLTTEGYGDITPKIWISRYIIIFTVLAFIFIIKPIHSKLSVLLEITKYSKMEYKKNSRNTEHILVLGECGIESYLAFLEELYDPDHGETNHDIIIMQRKQDKELMSLIRSFPFSPNIFYFVGNSLVEKDLKRCQVEKSLCAVILANRLAKNKKMEDFSNIMKAFSIKKYHRMFWKEKDEDIRICIQLLLPETKEMCHSSLLSDDEINSGNTQIICVEQIKLQLLSKSCICQGITTIVASLITSKKPTLEENFDLLSFRQNNWIREYLNGIQQEIYFVKVKAELIHNMKFIDIVKIVYKISGLVVIGIDVIVEDFKPLVCLNPANYIIAPFDTLIYILADRQPDGNELNNLIYNYLEKENKGVVAKNKEMTKLLRLKNYFWNRIANIPDYYHNKEMQSSLGIKFSNQSATNSFRVNNKNNNKNISQMSFHNKKLPLIRQGSIPEHQSPMHLKNFYRQKLERYAQISQDFFYTVLPRTISKAENVNPEKLQNHIIILGIGFNLKNLIMPLRASSMKNYQYPILIMDKKEHISIEIWKEIEYFPDIYYMQGNPMKNRDLQRAGVKKAKGVIILSKLTSNNESNSNMVDMDTIFIYKAIKNEIKAMTIIAELISVSALSFLNSEKNDENSIKDQGYWLSPSFAVGEIFIGSMLDTLICQVFYNPFITNIIKQLIMGSAGSNFSTNFQNKLNEKKITQSTLYLLPIKEELLRLGCREINTNMFYREIFDFFIKNNMVPIGLYRNNQRLYLEEKNQPYVYLCPGKDDLVDIDKDKIYILSNERFLNASRMRRDKTSRIGSRIQINTASRLIDKSNELTLNLVQKIKKVVNNGNQKLRNNFSINKITNEVKESMRNELNNMYDDLIGNKIEKLEEDKK